MRARSRTVDTTTEHRGSGLIRLDPRRRGDPRRAAKLWIARALAGLHVAILSLFVFGWALPWRGMLIAVVIAAPLVQAGWWFFGDLCVLTLLEKRLRGEPTRPAAGSVAPPPNFIAELAASILGRPVDRRWVNATTRLVMWSAFTIATVRLSRGGGW